MAFEKICDSDVHVVLAQLAKMTPGKNGYINYFGIAQMAAQFASR